MYSPLSFSYRTLLIQLTGPASSGLFVFSVLHHLFIPERISVGTAIIISILVFGLINYYRSSIVTETGRQDLESGKTFDRYIENNNYINITPALKRLFFVLVYFISLVIVAFGSNTDRELFVPWEQISLLQIVQLIAATTIAFFAPGYAIICILDGKKRFGLLPRLLIGYLFSIFLTGFTTYFTASLGADFSLTKNVLIIIYSCVLASFIIYELAKYSFKFNNKNIQYYRGFLSSPFQLRSNLNGISKKWTSSLRKNGSVIIVFASLVALVVLSTYYLYGGFLIGDQWFHHGRALSFIAGTFEAASLSGEHLRNPPFMPAFLAGFFTLSSMPSVNAYVAINFLNIIPVFAFYYMFSKWVPGDMRKAALLASVLFVLSSGFGWLYVLYLSVANQVTSEQASLGAFNDARIKSLDIFQPSSFIGVDHPGITSPLLVISLPAGLVLLGLLIEGRSQRGPKMMGLNYLVIITIISLVGTLSHPEFYLFMIISSLAVLIFKLPRRNFIFAAFIISTSLAILLDMLPGQYFTATKIVGIPVIHLTWVFTSAIFMLSVFTTRRSAVFSKIYSKITHFMFQNTRTIRRLYRDFVEFPLLIALVSMLAYFFLFTFLVWGELTLKDVQIQTSKSGQQEVPWYLYPMKLGICGLLGLVFVASYLLRRFEKEVFIFSIIIIIALLAGPYYDEHRFSKYIMMGLVGLAAIFLFNIMVSLNLRSKTAVNAKPALICISILTSFMVVSASMSVILYIGYSALAMENHYRPFERDLPKRNFPALSEINMFNFLYNDLVTSGESFNVVVAPDEYKIRQDGFAGKLEAFVGIPTRKLLQGQPALEASTLEDFLYTLNNTDTKYIILQKEDIISGLNYANIKAAAERPADNDLIEPARFALDSFKKAYENHDYIVVSVPYNLSSVSENANIVKSVENNMEINTDVKTSMDLSNIVKLPGEISDRAKQRGIGVPWQTVMSSEISIGMAIMIPIIAVFFLRRLSMPRQID